MLTDAQMDQICSILSSGCDRETAAGVVECSVVDVGRAIAELPQFAVRVRRAEATAEFRHMQNILNATKDGKYWRASVWWLERRSPERFARRPAGAITPRQLEEAVVAWNDMLQQRFDSPTDQERITACLNEITASLDLILDAQSAATLLKRHISQLQLEYATPNDVAAELENSKDAEPHSSEAQP